MRYLVIRLSAVIVALAAVEIGVRMVSAFVSGPSVLLYGTPWQRPRFASSAHTDVALHDAQYDGYTKYAPHELKWAVDSRGRHTVRINNHGLRGPDFDVAKAPGVRRVLTLGASSTFGFGDRDHETYPYYLQRVLDRRAGRGRFEVINFAVPHAYSGAMVAMFLAEGLALSPDVVTVYEGVNDSEHAVFDAVYGTGWRPDGQSPFLTVVLVRQLLNVVMLKPSRIVVTDAMVRAGIARYLASLDTIAAACRAHGARMIAVTQQARSLTVKPPRLHGLTYADEAAEVERLLAAPDGTVDLNAMQFAYAAIFLVHSHITRAVREWAPQHGIDLVDGVKVLDRQRDLVVSWVHLAPPANKKLAEAIAAAIVPDTASGRTPADGLGKP